jgi:hypothetical protein
MPKKIVVLLIITFFAASCSKNNQENEGILGKKNYEPNLNKRVLQNEGALLSGVIGKKGSNNFEFASSNVLWRATLEAFDNIPLSNVDYAGGVIITDWYSTASTDDSIKIVVNFTSDELKSSSINISSFKKNCNDQLKCSTAKMQNDFNDQIKNKIIDSARKLSIKKIDKK